MSNTLHDHIDMTSWLGHCHASHSPNQSWITNHQSGLPIYHTRRLLFLGATKYLYNWLCPLVGWLVGWSVGGVMHLFDNPHAAPYWPTWPCFLYECKFCHEICIMIYLNNLFNIILYFYLHEIFNFDPCWHSKSCLQMLAVLCIHSWLCLAMI